MAKEMVVLQGQSFSIELQSMFGSTNYGWTLTKLPQGIALLSTETISTATGVAPVIQRFWFGAVSATEDKSELEFTLINFTDMSATKKTHTVLLNVISSDSDEFAKFSENSDATIRAVAGPAMPYGLVLGSQEAVVKYGYPCGVQDAPLMKYGYPCGVQDAPLMKYGYPCNTSEAPVVKYGYPCGVNDAPLMKYGYPCDLPLMKYGYPCGAQDAAPNREAALKYGYPCGTNDAPLMKYGYPCDLPLMKYGYPCGVQDAASNREAAMAYGYKNCTNDVALKYGYPCGVQDAALKYGYPCGVQDATSKKDAAFMYGFKCDSQKSDC